MRKSLSEAENVSDNLKYLYQHSCYITERFFYSRKEMYVALVKGDYW
jgi:hypothetical protein